MNVDRANDVAAFHRELESKRAIEALEAIKRGELKCPACAEIVTTFWGDALLGSGLLLVEHFRVCKTLPEAGVALALERMVLGQPAPVRVLADFVEEHYGEGVSECFRRVGEELETGCEDLEVIVLGMHQFRHRKPQTPGVP